MNRYTSPHEILNDLQRVRLPGKASVPQVDTADESREEWLRNLLEGDVVPPLRYLDPVLGIIALPEPIAQLVYSIDVQRLHDIKQLSLVDRGEYPSAEHSRFVHSLGVAELVARAIRRLRQVFDGSISREDELETIAAALLHDVGHGPLGHVMDEFFARKGRLPLGSPDLDQLHLPHLSHERFTQIRIIDDWYPSSLANRLRAYGLRPDIVAARALGRPTGDGYDFLSQLVAGYGLNSTALSTFCVTRRSSRFVRDR